MAESKCDERYQITKPRNSAISSSINTKKTTLRHIKVLLLRTKDKMKNVKAAEEKRHIIVYPGGSDKDDHWFLI